MVVLCVGGFTYSARNLPEMCGCFVLSQGRASSETPGAASSDVEPGQGQF